MHRASRPASAIETSASDTRARAEPARGYNGLELVHEVVQHPWDAAALICLGDDQPLRYTELHRKMVSFAGRHLGESELTRTRHRLIRRALIQVGHGPNGRQVYTITGAGQKRLKQIKVLMAIAPRLEGVASEP
jgi:hypothetical protein